MEFPATDGTALFEALLDFDEMIFEAPPGDTFHLYELLHHFSGRIAVTQSFYICLYSPETETLVFPYNYDGQDYDEPISLPLGNGPTSWVIRNKQPLVLSNETASIHQGGIPFGNTNCRSQSAVHVPIRTVNRRDVVGVMSAQSYHPDVYTPTVIRGLQWLADRGGAFLERERDEQARRMQIQNLEAKLKEKQVGFEAVMEDVARLLKRITDAVERLCVHSPTGITDLPNALVQLRRECHRGQTLVSQLPFQSAPSSTSTPPLEEACPVSPLIPPSLTPREEELYQLIVSGVPNEEIAARLFITTNTVKFHLKNIYRKLGVRSRLQLAPATPSHPTSCTYPAGRTEPHRR